MKSLVTGMCFLAASQAVFCAEEYKAYRLGQYDKAFTQLFASAPKDPVAQYYLGQMFLHGYGQMKNLPKALSYFKQSAEKGYLPSVLFMAKYTLFQENNMEGAIPWFKKAANSGDLDAQMLMAAAYQFGLGVKPNKDVAIKYVIDAAKNGNAIAQFSLAQHFLDSKHASNSKLGLIWLGKSAAANNPYAITKLAVLSILGKGVEKDEATGMETLKGQALANFTPAMIALGEVALAKNQYQEAIDWFKKAIDLQDKAAILPLAHVYLKEKTPVFDAKEGFTWTLRAANEFVPGASSELVNLYKKGIGVEANPDLAANWSKKSTQADKQTSFIKAALWLTNGKQTQLSQTSLAMKGLLVGWQNTSALKDNIQNQAPKFETMGRQALFKPKFELIKPTEVAITSYYDALINASADGGRKAWVYPSYPLNPHIEVLQLRNNYVVNRVNLPAPLMDANYYVEEDKSQESLMDRWTPDWEQQLNYMAVFQKLYFRALLGDAQTQFEIGQMFEYGLGVEKNFPAAMVFYQNAAEQGHLGAEYNLGMMYLQHPQDEKSDQLALDFLTDSAFKGNRNAQFVLAKVLEKGKMADNGQQYIKADPEQATSMLYLAASNGYGPAQYELAQHLVRSQTNSLTREEKIKQNAMIHQLYQEAADSGVIEALLPLAFYNAMDEDKIRQHQAYLVAKDQAELGDERAALLLGLLYDRGLGVGQDADIARYWYEKSGQNLVSQFILGSYLVLDNKDYDKQKAVRLLEQSQASNFSYADFNLAVINQLEGKDFLNDLTKAYSLGNNQAGILLADYYLAKEQDPQKLNQAKLIYEGLAQKGDPIAQLKLGFLYDKGLGGVSQPEMALEWYKASASQGNAYAQFLLAQFYQIGALGAPDYKEAMQWYQKAAAKLPQASIALGFIYETVDENYLDAFKAYEKAANEQDAIGIYNLGLMYYYGKGVAVDYAKAKDLFTQAANKGLRQAMSQLAGMYFNGFGLPQDLPLALSWYQKAADLGDRVAIYQLGLMSEAGLGVKQSLTSALSYYQKAADLGDEKAMGALARLYLYGLGVETDLQKSASFYQKLIDRQNSYAQYQLGVFYLDGRAGQRLPDKGKQLLKMASDNGNTKARSLLQQLEAQTQARSSYFEPVLVNQVVVDPNRKVDFMYFDALNEWNRGDEQLSKMMLQGLLSAYPNYKPAKVALERLN